MLALYKWIPDIHTFRECVFAGHFGPMGVGAVFISTLAAVKLPDPKEISKNGELAEGGTPAQIDYLGHSIQPIVAFMVLISIMIRELQTLKSQSPLKRYLTMHANIDGLSIPFFSLGKRVHSIRHTWSRHNTVEGGRPEWANQTRQIQPGEEIVVNRDDAAERGEMGYDEKRASAPTSVGEGSSGSVEGREHGTGEHVVSAEGRHGRMGVAFDDTQDVETTEWREGQDLVIERSPGRGEEVSRAVMGERLALMHWCFRLRLKLSGMHTRLVHAPTRLPKELLRAIRFQENKKRCRINLLTTCMQSSERRPRLAKS